MLAGFARRGGLAGRRRPARQQAERVGRRGAGFGAVDVIVRPGSADSFHHLEGQVEVADDGMVQGLGASPVQAHVVGCLHGVRRRVGGDSRMLMVGDFNPTWGNKGFVALLHGPVQVRAVRLPSLQDGELVA